MQDLIFYKSWIIAIAFMLLFGLERIYPAAPIAKQPWPRIIKNLAFWPINIGLALLWVLPISWFAAQHILWNRPAWLSGLSGLMIDLLILDLFIYAWHRLMHVMPFLWRFHKIHHLDQYLDTTSAIRFHAGEIFLATWVRAVVIYLFALPFTSVLVFETLVLLMTLFHHSNLAIPLRLEKFLAKIIITPSIHWVHHNAEVKNTDSNYATLLSCWDRLFATYSNSSRTTTMLIGIDGQSDKSFMALLLCPFRKNHPQQ